MTHQKPKGVSDNFAYYTVQTMRKSFDLLSGYTVGKQLKTLDERAVVNRCIFLETGTKNPIKQIICFQMIAIFLELRVRIASAQFPLFLSIKAHTIFGTIYPPDSYPKIFQLKNASRSCLEKVKLQYIDCTQD